jgi:hypothetical protein
MTYQLYGYAPEPEPVEIFHDFEEAAVRCEELVHEDGYDSGEVWDTDGDLVYRVGRRPATLARPEPDVIMAPRPTSRRGAVAVCADEPPMSCAVEREVDRALEQAPARAPDAERAIRVVRDDDRRRAAASARRPSPTPAATSAAAPAPQPAPPAPAPSVWVLGDRTGAPTLWFGDSE